MMWTPIEIIDFVLELICEDDKLHPYATAETIWNAYCNERFPGPDALKGINFTSILDKLVKDCYVKQETVSVLASEYVGIFRDEIRYSITFEGMLFHQQGGYKKELLRSKAENNRIVALEKAAASNRRWMLWLTVLVAIGTSVAAWYYAIEIWKSIQKK